MIKPFLYWEGKIALIYAFLQYIIFGDGKGRGSCKIIHSESYFFLLKKLLLSGYIFNRVTLDESEI